MTSWHLFGEAGTLSAATEVVSEQLATQESSREGIEKGARETSLDLTLRGVVASTEDGLGHAIIEHQKRQEVYAVEDKLPVSGQVSLAKVMPRQVVLDNGGTYELLTLFEDSALDAQMPAQEASPAYASATDSEQSQQRNDRAHSTGQELSRPSVPGPAVPG